MCDRSHRFARLACIRRTASVHPEPGSNSLNNACNRSYNSISKQKTFFHYSIVKVRALLHMHKKKRISEKSALQVYIERYLVSTDLFIRYIKQTLAMKINTIEENSYLRIADLPLRWDNFLLMGTSGFDRRVFC